MAALTVQTPNTSTYAYKLVAVGFGGVVGYSGNGQTWAWQTLPSDSTLPRVNLTQVTAGQQPLFQLGIPTYTGGQFLIAGASGKLWRSGDAQTWDNATWSDMSSHTGTTASAVSLFRYVSSKTYQSGVTRAYTWLLYGDDGTARYAR